MDSPVKCYIQPIACRNKEVYTEVNTLIYEYLEVNGLENALQIFSKECQSKNLPCPKLPSGNREVKAAFTHYDGEQLLKNFDEGELDSFLKLWKSFQTHIQVTSEDMKKLEVYIRVHFAIYPKAHQHSEIKQTQAMQALKAFFEEHSASLSSDATILPLFALPFVPDPRPHPIFKDLFHDAWTAKLRAQLETTVNKYFELLQENITTHCKLAAVVLKSPKEQAPLQPNITKSAPTALTRRSISTNRSNPAHGQLQPKSGSKTNNQDASTILYHQQRFFQLVGVQRKTRRVMRNIKENYGKLLRVCGELISSLENSVGDTGSSVKLDIALQQCQQIFPEIFTDPKSGNGSGKPDLDHFKKLTASLKYDKPLDTDVSLMFLGIEDIGPDALNYEKVKDDLTSDKVPLPEKYCLLQALRWLITKTPQDSRNFVMECYVKHDLFGVAAKKTDVRHKLFSCMLSPNPTYQKELMARLINAFASTWTGRNYLTSTDYVIDIFIKSLSTFKSPAESFICNMVIATLQKLSLRKSMRKTMIDQNVIPWLVKYLKMELDRDIIRDEVQQLAHDWKGKKQPTPDGNSNPLDDDNITIPVKKCDPSSSSFYGDTYNNYLMEYAWALLMNLCLHDESIKSSLSVDYEFLHCIITMLMNKASFECIPYVVSTLFSLLRNPEMFDKAKTMNLDRKLEPTISRQAGEVANHLKHLLVQLYEKDNVDRLTASGETDYDDTDNPDPDEIETEIELPESWMNNQTETLLRSGDDLLIRTYLFKRDIVPASPVELDDTDTETPQTDPSTTSSNPSALVTPSNTSDSTTSGGIILRPTTPTRNLPKACRNLTCPIDTRISKESTTTKSSSNEPSNVETITPEATCESVISSKTTNGVKKVPSIRNPLLHPEPSDNLLLSHDEMPQLIPLPTTGNTVMGATANTTMGATANSKHSDLRIHKGCSNVSNNSFQEASYLHFHSERSSRSGLESQGSNAHSIIESNDRVPFLLVNQVKSENDTSNTDLESIYPNRRQKPQSPRQ